MQLARFEFVTTMIKLASGLAANTTCSPNAGLMLAQRRRRWANIRPALGQRGVFVGLVPLTKVTKHKSSRKELVLFPMYIAM